MHEHPYPDQPHRVESHPPMPSNNILLAFLDGRMEGVTYMRLADLTISVRDAE